MAVGLLKKCIFAVQFEYCMKRILSIVGLFLFFCTMHAQVNSTPSDKQTGDGDTAEGMLPSIVDKINSAEPGKGVVRVIQDKSVSDRIGRPKKQAAVQNNDYVEMSGWRIQVFTGNNQRLSKEEAFKKETDIKLTFPELDTYVQYTAPFWRLRVGDCRTYKEANDVMIKLKRAFPAFGREMSIIKETILIKK